MYPFLFFDMNPTPCKGRGCGLAPKPICCSQSGISPSLCEHRINPRYVWGLVSFNLSCWLSLSTLGSFYRISMALYRRSWLPDLAQSIYYGKSTYYGSTAQKDMAEIKHAEGTPWLCPEWTDRKTKQNQATTVAGDLLASDNLLNLLPK